MRADIKNSGRSQINNLVKDSRSQKKKKKKQEQTKYKTSNNKDIPVAEIIRWGGN